MNKFKRYFGLVTAALMSLLLINGEDFRFPYAVPVTAMDSTGIVKLTLARTDSFKMWRQATDFMNRCGKPPADACKEMSRAHYFADLLAPGRRKSGPDLDLNHTVVQYRNRSSGAMLSMRPRQPN